MTPPDDNHLLKEILADERLSQLRANSLQQGLAAMRQARRKRFAARVAITLILGGGLWLAFVPPKSETRIALKSAPEAPGKSSPRAAPKTSSVKIISDEDLLALFPDRSVALIGSPGQQQFVFLDAPEEN
jgi:hypothetical protein